MSYSRGDNVEHGVVSDCCGAQVVAGMCCDCFEHCEEIPEDDEE
jgi:hypothetical protein